MSPYLAELLEDVAGPERGIDPAAVRNRARQAHTRRRAQFAVAAGLLAVVGVFGVVATRGGENSQLLETIDTVPDAVDTVPDEVGTVPAPLGLDGWQLLPSGPTDGRTFTSVVWTGDDLIVWGGEGDSDADLLASGAAFNLVAGTWRDLAPAPINPRSGHAAVWTGSEMITCCGGVDPSGDIAAYDPIADTWRLLQGQSELETVKYPGAVWTGDRMLVTGGVAFSSMDGVLAFDPGENAWEGITELAPVTIERQPDVFWTGDELLVVPRTFTDDPPASYDPASRSWRAFTPPPPELAIDGPSAVWTGDELLLWGVSRQKLEGEYRAVGAALNPQTGSWRTLSDSPVGVVEWFPGVPQGSAAVWDSARRRMIIVTGAIGVSITDQGADTSAILAYYPDSDVWERLPDLPGRTHHPATVLAEDLLIVDTGRFWSIDLSSDAAQGQSEAAGVFDDPTGLVLLASDGLGGIAAVDLDTRQATRRTSEGGRAGDQPYRFTRAGDVIIEGWGEIWAVDIASAQSRMIAQATIYLPDDEDSIWVIDWPSGGIGSGEPTYRRTDGSTSTVTSSSRSPIRPPSARATGSLQGS